MKQTEDTQVVVLMGGLGKRLNKKLPKAMVDVCGKPFFNYQLNLMKQAGFKNFLFCVGYKAEVIKNYFKDGKEFGVSITYSLDNALGTAGALKNAYEYLDEDFMLIYGDSFMDVNYSEIITAYYKLKIKAMIAVIKNENLYDKSNVILRDGGGGFLLLYCSDDKSRLISALKKINLKPTWFSFEHTGVKTIFNQ